MKILNGARVYVENIDVAFFIHNADAMPVSLLAELTKVSPYFVVPNENGMAFEKYFEWPMNTLWLMEQEWLEDYDLLAAIAPADLRAYKSSCLLKRNQMVQWYNEREAAEQIELYSKMMAVIAEEDHRLLSVHALIETLNDEKLEIQLPAELEHRIRN